MPASAEGAQPRAAVRAAGPDDRPFVVAAAERLAEFGPPPWRTARELIDGEVRTLHVFEGNRHARSVYEHVGYRPEVLRYVKTLDS